MKKMKEKNGKNVVIKDDYINFNFKLSWMPHKFVLYSGKILRNLFYVCLHLNFTFLKREEIWCVECSKTKQVQEHSFDWLSKLNL